MNTLYIKHLVHSNKVVLISITAVLLFYMSTIMMMYDPTTVDAMMVYIEALPEALIKALNFDMSEFTFLGFLSGYYYGFLAMTFPLIFSMMFSYNVLAKGIDTSSITHLLTSGKSRIEILMNILITYMILLAIMILLLIGMSYVLTSLMFDGVSLDARFLTINLYLYLFHFMMGCLMLSASALIPSASLALGAIIGLPLTSMVLDMVARLGDELAWLRFFSLHTLFNADSVVLNESIVLPVLVMVGISSVLIIGLFVGFKQRDIIV